MPFKDFKMEDLTLPTDFKRDDIYKRDRGNLPDPEPRKGMYRLVNTTINKKQQKMFTLSTATLGRLANTDPITWAIRRAIKSYISQIKWDIVPDTENQEAELDRFEELAISNLQPYSTGKEEFISEALDQVLVTEMGKNLVRIMKGPEADKKPIIRWYIQSLKRRIKQEAESHRHDIKRIFECPNSTDRTWRTLQEKILDDLLIYDSGVLVKNWSATGKLAELYTIPGHEVKIYRNEDMTAPLPPEPAFVWEQMGINRAEFSSEELIYIMENPQQSGYGMSPLEVAAYIITASLFADEYQIDYFKHSNVPPGVFDLGKGVDSDQLDSFRAMWENEVQGRGGQHRMMFISGSEDPKFIPMSTRTNKEMQLIDYLKWTMGVKCAAYGISPQDLGFMDSSRGLGGGGVAQVQEKLSKARGVQSLLTLLEEHYNREIVKSEFSYRDVKFEWLDIDLGDPSRESTIDIQDIKSGVISRNDRRQKLGLKPIDGGDVPVIETASGLIPVEGLSKLPVEPPAPVGEAPPEPPKMGPNGKPIGEEEVPVVEEEEVPPETEEEEVLKEKRVKIVVNRRKPVLKQYQLLHNTVKSLQDQGVQATLLIGFQDK